MVTAYNIHTNMSKLIQCAPGYKYMYIWNWIIRNKIIELCFRYLNDEDDDVSMAVIPFAVGYVGVLKVTLL